MGDERNTAALPPETDRAPAIVKVTDVNWRDFTAGDAVLMLGKSTCRSCIRLADEIEHEVRAHHWKWPTVGKVVLDRPGLSEFKQRNPWLQEIDVLPYVVVYHDGERAESESTSKLARLESMLAHVFEGEAADVEVPDGHGALARVVRTGGIEVGTGLGAPATKVSGGPIAGDGASAAEKAVRRALWLQGVRNEEE